MTVHHAADTIPQMEDIEIDQQAHSHSAEAQVREQLCFVNRMDRLSRLHLHDYPMCNN
jgi:hypothetical protein